MPSLRHSRFIAACIVSILFGVECGEKRPEPEAEPKYADESGEEVFGPEYRPTSPSVPLLVGIPNGGIRIPVEMKGRQHEDFRPRDEPLRGPDTTFCVCHCCGR